MNEAKVGGFNSTLSKPRVAGKVEEKTRTEPINMKTIKKSSHLRQINSSEQIKPNQISSNKSAFRLVSQIKPTPQQQLEEETEEAKIEHQHQHPAPTMIKSASMKEALNLEPLDEDYRGLGETAERPSESELSRKNANLVNLIDLFDPEAKTGSSSQAKNTSSTLNTLANSHSLNNKYFTISATAGQKFRKMLSKYV